MAKILLTGAPIFGNFGGPSLLSSTGHILKESVPSAEFKLFSKYSKEDQKLEKEYGVKVVEIQSKEFLLAFLRCLTWRAFRSVGFDIRRLLNHRILREYLETDMFIDIWGISFSDLAGELTGHLMEGIPLLMGKCLGKPVVKFTADMGPFTSGATRWLAKFCLDRVDLTIARGHGTKRYLQEAGVRKNIYVRPDSAFVLPPASSDQIGKVLEREKLNKRPLIGMIVTTNIDHKLSSKDIESENKYTIALAQLADYLVQKLDCTIVFIPNVVGSTKYDDVFVGEKVYRRIKNKDNVRTIKVQLSAGELKGLIGECSMIVGSRYHSIIAATSMHVPCVVIGWGHKYNQVMGMLGQEKFVCDFKDATFEDLREKVDKVWENREEIRAELKSRIPSIKKSVLSAGRLIEDLVKVREENLRPQKDGR